jgi:ABC-type lipoprotein export system ATPase subunit
MSSDRTAVVQQPAPVPVATVRDVSRVLVTHGVTVTLLSPTSMELTSATLVALAGPSGSGKTTLCNLLLGWDQPDQGTIVHHRTAAGWAHRSVAPQRLALIQSLSCADNIRLASWGAGALPGPPTVAELAALLDIEHLLHRFPRELSLGEQQRVAVARALVGAPHLVILDEPTCHQDEAHADALLAALQQVVRAGSCVVVATHDPDLFDAADQVVHLTPPE